MTISKINKEADFIEYLKSSIKILLFSLIITMMSMVVFPSHFVIFGILHLIGVSIILAYLFRRFEYLNLFIGIIFVIFGNILKNQTVNFDWLLIFGLHSTKFHSVDYFPIFPWFGIILIGMFLGKMLYSADKRKFELNSELAGSSKSLFAESLCFLGKNSLIIYPLHLIVIYSLFFSMKLLF